MPKSFKSSDMEDTIEKVIAIRLLVPGPSPFSSGLAMYLTNLKSSHPLQSVTGTNIYGLLQPPFSASATVISVQGL